MTTSTAMRMASPPFFEYAAITTIKGKAGITRNMSVRSDSTLSVNPPT